MKSATQIWRYVRYYVSFGRLMHMMPCCIPCAVYNTSLLAVTVQTWIIVECLPVFWRQMGLSSYRARLEYHQDSFQDACVNHNKLDADNESVTRMHTPHSKSSVEGIINHNHESRNRIPSSTIMGYVAYYG